MPTQADIEHLLRRTEFVARSGRVSELLPLSLDADVDNILAAPADPGVVTLTQDQQIDHIEPGPRTPRQLSYLRRQILARRMHMPRRRPGFGPEIKGKNL